MFTSRRTAQTICRRTRRTLQVPGWQAIEHDMPRVPARPARFGCVPAPVLAVSPPPTSSPPRCARSCPHNIVPSPTRGGGRLARLFAALAVLAVLAASSDEDPALHLLRLRLERAVVLRAAVDLRRLLERRHVPLRRRLGLAVRREPLVERRERLAAAATAAALFAAAAAARVVRRLRDGVERGLALRARRELALVDLGVDLFRFGSVRLSQPLA